MSGAARPPPGRRASCGRPGSRPSTLTTRRDLRRSSGRSALERATQETGVTLHRARPRRSTGPARLRMTCLRASITPACAASPWARRTTSPSLPQLPHHLPRGCAAASARTEARPGQAFQHPDRRPVRGRRATGGARRRRAGKALYPERRSCLRVPAHRRRACTKCGRRRGRVRNTVLQILTRPLVREMARMRNRSSLTLLLCAPAPTLRRHPPAPGLDDGRLDYGS